MDDYESPAVDQEPEEDEQRSYALLGTIGLIVIVIVLVLLFWRSCDSTQDAGTDSGGGGVIEKLSDLDMAEDGVAIWVKPDASVEAVLARHGLAEADYTSFGEGTYVVDAGGHDAAALVAELKKDSDLYDAGFIYSEE